MDLSSIEAWIQKEDDELLYPDTDLDDFPLLGDAPPLVRVMQVLVNGIPVPFTYNDDGTATIHYPEEGV